MTLNEPSEHEIAPERREKLDQLSDWQTRHELQPEAVSWFNVMVLFLEDDALDAPLPAEPTAAPNHSPAPPQPLSPLQELKTIWDKIDFASPESQERYVRLSELLGGKVGAAAVKSVVASSSEDLKAEQIKFIQDNEGVSLSAQGPKIRFLKEKSQLDESYKTLFQRTLQILVNNPELEITLEELWRQVFRQGTATRNNRQHLISFLNEFITPQGRPIFNIQGSGQLTTFQLSPNLTVTIEDAPPQQPVAEKIAPGEKPSFPDKYRLTSQDYYLALEYLNGVKDIRDQLQYRGLPQVSDQALHDLEPFRPYDEQLDVLRRKLKISAIEISKNSVQKLMALVDDTYKYKEFLAELNSAPGDPSHLVVKEFLSAFDADAVKRHQLKLAWDIHIERERQRKHYYAQKKEALTKNAGR